jgi:hypothetical protein
MSDYFNILASRLAGAPEAVRPMLPSRYEPAKTDVSRASEGEGEEILLAEAERDSPGALPSEAPSRQKEKTEPAVKTQLHGHKFSEPANAKTELPGLPSKFSKPSSGRQISPASPSRDNPARDQRRRHVSSPTLLPSLPDEPLLPQRKARRRDQRPAIGNRLTEADVTVLPGDRTSSRPERPSRPGDRASLLSAPGTGSPAIQITIGRIEVQASLPPATVASPAPKRAAAPVLSLGEYLTRRNVSRP